MAGSGSCSLEGSDLTVKREAYYSDNLPSEEQNLLFRFSSPPLHKRSQSNKNKRKCVTHL